MKREYKVTVNIKNQSGIFPDFFGKTETFYVESESIVKLSRKLKEELADMSEGRSYISYSLDIIPCA